MPASAMRTRVPLLAAALSAAAWFIAFAPVAAENWKSAFDGKSLAGWHALGAARWSVAGGEIAGAGAGWLVSDRSYQDFSIKFSFRATGGGQTGVLIGMEKEGDRANGIYVSFAPGDLGAYLMTVDAQGQEIERHKPVPPARAGGAPPAAAAPAPAAPAGRSQTPSPTAGHPLAAGVPRPALKTDDWNQVEVRIYTQAHAQASTLQVVLNHVVVAAGFPPGSAQHGFGRGDRISGQPEVGRFGPVALRVAGATGGEMHFKELAIDSFTEIAATVERLSKGFRIQQVTNYFYSDGTCVGDLNHDGHPDVATGPIYWIGPDFKTGREIDLAQPMDITDYSRVMGCEIADFTGDGWPDVLETGYPGGGAVYLYVNPQNALRRWPRYPVVDSASEIYAVADMNGDGRPDFVYGGSGGYPANWATPDPANPTKPWIIHHVGESANWGNHGFGVGDINGDGRLDVLRAWGWWEHPAVESDPWKYHPEQFGRSGPAAGPGGAQMYVYDANGDGLPDVITSLEAHAYGLAWFEQKRDTQGKITFDQHMIMDKDPAASHGVFFTQLHGLAIADIDGDGLKDLVTGMNKYNWGGHYDYSYPNEEGDGVVYWFKLVRKAGGQVDFIPHLIYNNSGISRQPRVLDLNGDGIPDLANAGRTGLFIFFGKKGTRDWTAVPR